jgi:hypothetical protein
MFTQLVDPVLLNPGPRTAGHQPSELSLVREQQRLDEIRKLERLRAARLARQDASSTRM